MILLIDVGNTRIKWAAVSKGLWLEQGYVANTHIPHLIEQWQVLSCPDQIVACCVADDTIIDQLTHVATEIFALPIAWLQVTKDCCDVTNHYKNIGSPDQFLCTLGPDRWASLIAVQHLYPGNRIVVNVGTAMTIDALTAKGEFLGGLILPGVRLMQSALTAHTARLPTAQGQYHIFPNTTIDAMYTGIITALSAAINTMAAKLATQCSSAKIQCIISGGDAELISPYLTYPYQRVETLVLPGLLIIAQSDAAVWQMLGKSDNASINIDP